MKRETVAKAIVALSSSGIGPEDYRKLISALLEIPIHEGPYSPAKPRNTTVVTVDLPTKKSRGAAPKKLMKPDSYVLGRPARMASSGEHRGGYTVHAVKVSGGRKRLTVCGKHPVRWSFADWHEDKVTCKFCRDRLPRPLNLVSQCV